jgi:hypothetical protein
MVVYGSVLQDTRTFADAGDRFNVAWAALDVRNSGSETSPGVKVDVLVKAYEMTVASNVGSLVSYPAVSPFPAYNANYSVVNKGLSGIQAVPSIAGRKYGEYTNILYSHSVDTGGDARWRNTCNVRISQSLSETCVASGGGRKAVDQTRIEPNPTDGKFRVYLDPEGFNTWTSYSLNDLRGNLIMQFSNQNKKKSSVIEGSMPKNLSKGLYLLRIQTPGGEKQMKLVYQ